MAGKIYLVGAGPGDPGMLTLKGLRCLAEADVVLYDSLANPSLLEYAPAAAERILVGKHGPGTRVDQETVTEMMLARARAGATVVRLKGGDPCIFGRAGEEALAAHDARIDFEIVPGVSSAVAVPAYAGIPLTHRNLASNVIFTTGYEYPKKQEPAVDWHELARSGSTLVILMTQRQLRANMERLIDGGLSPDTPTAVIQWGTRADQRTVVGTAASIAALVEAEDLHPPALAVVGEVVSLRPQLNWFERKPLFGRRIVVTRAREQAAEFAGPLEAHGAEVLLFPTIEIVPAVSMSALDAAIARATEFDWVVFTSANAVRIFFDRLRERGADIRAWHRARLAAIGTQTADALRSRSLHVDLVPDEFRAEAVVDALAGTGIAGRRVLLPRAAGARSVLPDRLRDMGAAVEDVATYRSELPARTPRDVVTMLRDGAVDLITFTSSSTVHNFVACLDADGRDLLARTPVGCIGPITAQTVREYGGQVAVQPERYTVAAFVEAILRHCASAPRRRHTSPH